MDLRRQLAVIRHWAWLIVACMLLAGGTAFLVSSSLPKTYEAKAVLVVGQSASDAQISSDYNQLLASQKLSQTYATMATTRPILQTVIKSLGLETTKGIPTTPDELRNRITTQAPQNNNFVYITVVDGNPDTASAIANTIADQLVRTAPAMAGQLAGTVDFAKAQLTQMQDDIAAIQKDIASLPATGLTTDQQQQLKDDQTRLAQDRTVYATLLQIQAASAVTSVSQVDPAIPPQTPSGPRVLLNTALAVLLGLIIALGIAFLAEYLDDTVKSPDDVAEVTGVSTLGAIVRMRSERDVEYNLTTVNDPRSPATEGFRTLRTNLEFASVDKPLRTILITSAVPSEGKTTIAANLAVVFAQTGKRVILLDSDLRRPGVHRVFDLPNSFGLTNLLRSDTVTIDDVAHEPVPGLKVVTTGALPPNPAELLASNRMKEVLAHLEASSDIVIVDSPPLQVVTDAALLASRTDGALLVIDGGRTRKGAVRQARETLDRVGARLLGASINRLSERGNTGYYYYYYQYQYYGKYSSSSGKSGSKPAAPEAAAR